MPSMVSQVVSYSASLIPKTDIRRYVVSFTVMLAVAMPVCCADAAPPQIMSSSNDIRTHPCPFAHTAPPEDSTDQVALPDGNRGLASQQPAALQAVSVTVGGSTGGRGRRGSGGGEGRRLDSRSPQSMQSVPNKQASYSAPTPPSSHSPSLSCWQSSEHMDGGGASGGLCGDGGWGDDGDGGGPSTTCEKDCVMSCGMGWGRTGWGGGGLEWAWAGLCLARKRWNRMK